MMSLERQVCGHTELILKEKAETLVYEGPREILMSHSQRLPS